MISHLSRGLRKTRAIEAPGVTHLTYRVLK
jgi:hypothetical protein